MQGQMTLGMCVHVAVLCGWRGEEREGYMFKYSDSAGGDDRVCSDSGSVEGSNFGDGSDFMIVEDSSDSEGEESSEVSEIGLRYIHT